MPKAKMSTVKASGLQLRVNPYRIQLNQTKLKVHPQVKRTLCLANFHEMYRRVGQADTIFVRDSYGRSIQVGVSTNGNFFIRDKARARCQATTGE